MGKFNFKAIKRLDKTDRQNALSKYHEWLEKEREKDKINNPVEKVIKSYYYLNNKICPYCRKRLIEKKEKKVTQRICPKHGLVQVARNYKHRKRKEDGETM